MRARMAFMTWGPPILGGLALLYLAPGAEIPPLPLVALFAGLALVGQWVVFPLIQEGYQTFGAVETLPAVVILGPLPAAVVAAFGVAVGNGLLRRRPLGTTLFNVGQRILSILFAGMVWSVLIEGRPVFDRPSLPLQVGEVEILPAVVGIVLAYALATALQVNAFAATTGERTIWSALTNAALQVPGTMVAGGSGLAIALLLAGILPQQDMGSFIPLLIGSLVVLLYMLNRQMVRESTNLHGAVIELLQTLDLDALLNLLADRVEGLAVPDMIGIFLRRPDEGYRATLTRGMPAVFQSLPPGLEHGVAAWAVENRRPLRIADYATDPHRSALTEEILGQGRVRSVLIVPLIAGDEPLGVLVLTKAIPRYFTASQERTIATLTAQAALGVKNAQLYESSRRALARVGALQQLARAAAAGADFKEIQQMLVNLAATTLGAHRGILALYDEHDRVLMGTAFHNLTPEDAAAWRTSLQGDHWRYREVTQAFREMRPVAVSDRLEAPEAPATFVPGLSRSVLAVPMSVHGRALGTILVGRPEPHLWTAEETDLLQAIASEGAVAIENARLSRATGQQLQQMRALEAISERINSQRDLHAIFDLIAESAQDVLGADRCGIYLYEGGEDAGPVQTFARGLPDEYIRNVLRILQQGTGPVGTALRSREPVVVTDVLTDPRAETIREAAKLVGYRTLAAFPLSYRDKLVGVLRLYHDTVRPYGPTEVALGAAFANQAAIAVQNTRLLQEAESKAHQLSLINRIVTRVALSLRPEDLYETLIEELHTTLNYPFVAILLNEGDHLRVMASRGYKDLRTTFALTEGLMGRVARTGQPALVEDVSRDPDYMAVAAEVTQSACVPIIQNGRVMGVIIVEVVVKTLTQADLNLLTTLAGEVTAAIRNASQLTEVQQARDELQALYESAEALSKSLELETILRSLVSVTCRRFEYDYGAILLMDEAGDLVIRASHGDPDAIGRRIPMGQGAEGRAAQGARPVFIPDITWDPLETSAVLKTGSKLAVPLLREERVIGVFSVGVGRPNALGDRDKRFLTTLAGYAVVTIENARLYEQTRYLAMTDGLTGLKNHRAFREALDQELERARRYGFPMSLIMIEIDKFKRYNDQYGHLRGDEVLRLVARILEREHRKNVDVVSRYGGDEFMVLLPHTVKTDAAEVAERIRRGIEAIPFIVEGEVTSVTVSLGVASYPEDGDNGTAIVDSVDRRMYAAKQRGGNSVELTTSA
jgi:diguanylate cyclase (GGDEF)-like protein